MALKNRRRVNDIVKKVHESFAFKKRSCLEKGHCENDLGLNKNEVRFIFGIFS